MPMMDIPALEAFMAAEFPQAAADYRITRLAENEVDLRLLTGSAHLRPGATVSGPALFALADVAVYLALLAMIGPVALAVTTNASIDFLRKPPAGGDLLAKARLLKLGRRLAVGDVHVHALTAGPVLARATLTYAIPPHR